ncbi:hypothetical protein FACS189464_0070 [Bacteroidia bacterium]|nr:hypothetical protein FACS189464_0070 [Bacteroidia bacterium]
MEIINDISVKAKKTRILPAEEIHRKYFSGVPADVFTQIVSADVVSSNLQKHKLGKYAKWMLHLYGKNRLKVEDLYKAQAYIPIFDKAAKANKLPEKDLNCYKSLAEMYAAIQPFINEQVISNKDEIQQIKEYESDRLYEDEVFTVIRPLSKSASCLYGKGTQWCTAASERNNRFYYYDARGELYIVIDKKNNRKYQFHLESRSFRDETDCSIKEPVFETIEATNGIIHFFQLEIDKKSFLSSDYCQYAIDVADKSFLSSDYCQYAIDVADGTLFISREHEHFGIRKLDKMFANCFDIIRDFRYLEVILAHEFDDVKKYCSKNDDKGLYVVRKGKYKGVFNYYTDSIQWGYTGKECMEPKQLLRESLLPSLTSNKMKINQNEDDRNTRIQKKLLEVRYSPVSYVGYGHFIPLTI